MQRRLVNRCCSRVGAVVLVCLLAGCRLALISDYDATTDQWITELQQTIDAHLSTLESLSTDEDSAAIERCQPGRFADTFRNIDARLRSLILRNEVRAKNTLTVEQLRLLQSSIDKLQQQQIARYAEAERSNNAAGCLSSEQVQVNREILEQHLRAVLKLELSKRDFRGD